MDMHYEAAESSSPTGLDQAQSGSLSQRGPVRLESVHQDPLSSLQGIDWDFASDNRRSTTRDLHPYPAKFIPEIPSTLIRHLSQPGDTVADVFCGSGTTLVEALRQGRNAIGVDASPLACLISKAKTTTLTVEERDTLYRVADDAHRRARSLAEGLFSSRTFISAGWRPDDETLDFWFQPFVIEELAECLELVRGVPEPAQTVAKAAFSAIVVAVSRQDSDTRYVRRVKNIEPGDTFRRFGRSVRTALSILEQTSSTFPSGSWSEVVHANVLDRPSIQPKSVDLVVCSPPYPNAYSYHLYHRTRMVWLGMDQPLFKKQEIGSHRKYSSKGKDAATVETFEGELRDIMGWLAELLPTRRYACFVVGDSTLKGERIDNADVISRAGSATGFREVYRAERVLNAKRKAFNPMIGKIKTERVLVLQREGEDK